MHPLQDTKRNVTNEPEHTPMTASPPASEQAASLLRAAMGGRHLVLVGLMGAGKTSVGKRLAARLHMPFIDSDHAIEQSANMTIPEIFALRGEAEFRMGERRVIARLLSEAPQVIATGGGAFMDVETRASIRQKGISLWLKAELPVLMRRVLRRGDRPLLQTSDPEERMRRLMEERYPIYAEADIVIESHEQPHSLVVEAAMRALHHHLGLPEPIPHPADETSTTQET